MNPEECLRFWGPCPPKPPGWPIANQNHPKPSVAGFWMGRQTIGWDLIFGHFPSFETFWGP